MLFIEAMRTGARLPIIAVIAAEEKPCIDRTTPTNKPKTPRKKANH